MFGLQFFEIVLGFPTAIFTTLLLITVGWWLISLMFGLGEGGADLDGTDFDGPDAGGDGADSGDSGDSGDGDSGGLGNILRALDLHLIPITLVLSIISIVGWGVSTLATLALVDDGGSLALVTGLAVIAASFVAGVFVAGRMGHLLAPLFTPAPAIRRRDLIGRVCVIRTGRVDADFGQAEVVDLELGTHIVQVRCVDGSSLSAGSRALIVDVDGEGVFQVSADVAGLV